MSDRTETNLARIADALERQARNSDELMRLALERHEIEMQVLRSNLARNESAAAYEVASLERVKLDIEALKLHLKEKRTVVSGE